MGDKAGMTRPSKRPVEANTVRPKKQRRGGRSAGTEAGLTDEIRAEIVTRLAMYDKVGDVHKDLLDRGIDISIQAVSHYVPGHAHRLAEKWVELFHKTREEFLSEMAKEPIANRAWRLRRLTELFHQATDKGDREEARKALEQAAKEVGNVYTNLAKVQGIALPGQVDAAQIPIDEMRNMLSDALAPAISRLKAQQHPTIQ